MEWQIFLGSKLDTVCFDLSTTRGVCKALFQNAAPGLAPELGWGVEPHWLFSVGSISSDVLWQFSSCQSASAFHLYCPYLSRVLLSEQLLPL